MTQASLLYINADEAERARFGERPGPDIRCLLAADAAQAWAVLARESVDMVLCDQVLPDGDGLEFLIELQRTHPDCYRMLLTAAPDDRIVQAVGLGRLYYFFRKPLADAELRMACARVLELKGLKSRNAELIASLEAKNIELQKSEAIFRSLLEHVPDGVLISRQDGTVAMVNHGAETLFRGRRRDFVDLPVESLFDAAPALAGPGATEQRVVQAKRLDGSTFTAELTANEADTPDALYAVMVVRDVTERQLAEVQQRDQNARLEQKVRERTAELERVNRQLSRQEKRKDILRRVASAANSTLHDSALETCLWEICRFLDLEFGQIWMVNADERLEKSGISCAVRFAGPRNADWSGDYLAGLLDSDQDLEIFHQTPPEAQSILAAGKPAAGSGCVLAFPVRVKGRVEAVFEFLSRTDLQTDEWSSGIIQDIAVEMSELFLRRSLETARVQVLVALQRSETRFRNLVESANAISWEMGWPGYELHYVSPGAENILGYNREFWYEPGFWKRTVLPEDLLLFEEQMDDCVGSNGQVSFEFRLATQGGQARWLRCFAYPQRSRGAETDKLSGIMFDITELKSAQDAAVQASVAKSSFLAMMSHELRTPLNGVIGLIELMGRSELDGDQRHMLATMRDSAFSLLYLIDDILDFSKIEAGRLELENIPFDLRQVLESTAENLAYAAAGKNLRLELIIDPDMAHRLRGDPVRFRQVLLNLAGNAIKFTRNAPGQPGRVLIRVYRPAADLPPGWFRVQVEDNGIGMSEDTKSKLFQPFTQGEGSTTRRFGGTGLGLSICARLVELMNSTISVESREGYGSVFTVDYRLAPDAAGDPPPEPAGAPVLVLAGDAAEEDAIAAALRCLGRRPRPVADLAELVSACAADAVQAVVVGQLAAVAPADWAMVRNALPQGRAVRLVSRGQALPEDSFAVAAYGAPLLPSNLARALEGLEPGEAAPQPGPAGRGPAAAPAPALAKILVAEDNETNQMVLVRQLESLGYEARVADDGQQALRLFESESFDLVLTDCHMPVMDGFALTAAIRAREGQGGRTPILAITANAVAGEAERCLAAGFDDCVTKPVEMRTLQSVLRRWLGGKPKTAGDPPPALAPEPAAAYTGTQMADFDPHALDEYIGTDPDSQKLLLSSFLRNLADLETGVRRALDEGDFDAAARYGHTLKSAARTVGALRLSELCAAVEAAGRAKRPGDLGSRGEDFSAAAQRARAAVEERIRRGWTDD